jgi:hypothetical protein
MRERVSETKLFRNMPQMDKKKRRAKERENVNFWCLAYVLPIGFCFSTTSTSFKTPTKPFCKNFLSLLG